MNIKKKLTSTVLLCASFCAFADITADIYQLNADSDKKGIGEKIGTVTFIETDKGLEIKTNIEKLTPGGHGFHVHENADCHGGIKDEKWVAGLAAGSHLDPSHSGHHLGPEGAGHLGDLPFLTADDKGQSKQTLMAKRLKLDDVKDHSIVIHQGADNYSDVPPMGGGGDRIACGVIKT